MTEELNKVIYGSGGCFPADTKVLTNTGYIDISKLKIGDSIISFDAEGNLHNSIVEEIFIHKDKDIYLYEYWGGKIKATNNHWVLNQHNAFSEIGKLTEHDCLVDTDNNLRPILSSKLIDNNTVYNLSVTPNHTYIAENIRVHNGGGGKKKSRAPKEAPDSLHSKEMAKVLDLVSEGEIYGLVNGAKSIYLDGTQLENPDGSLNFADFNYDIRSGTQNQTNISGYSGIESTELVDIELLADAVASFNIINGGSGYTAKPTINFSGGGGTGASATTTISGGAVTDITLVSGGYGYTSAPSISFSGGGGAGATASCSINSGNIVKTIYDPDIDRARVTINIPQLTNQNIKTGDINGSEVDISLQISSNGGPYVNQVLSYEEGQTINWNDTYRFSYTVKTENTTNTAFAFNNSTGITSTTLYAYTQINTTAQINKINIQAVWVGLSTVASSNAVFTLQYRVTGAGSWTTYSTYSFAGGYSLIKIQNPSSMWYLYENIGYNAPQKFIQEEINLPLNNYEFRTVKTSGDGYFGIQQQYTKTISQTYTDKIKGKTISGYKRSYNIALTGSPPWNIKLIRSTPNSLKSNIQNKTFWDTLTSIIDDKLSYPNSAMVALTIDSEQFSHIPNRGYEIYGIKVKIPSNYNPWTKVYTGIWDGTFVVNWTDNPAWVFYDILTNSRYGLGEFISEAQVDKWSLYSIAQYCDEMVPDGYGGTENRFTCNLYLQTKEEAFTVVKNIASIFRSMIYWSAGAISVVQDAPADPVAIFTKSNVVNGEFSYGSTSKSSRHTVALISWNDPEDGYKSTIEYIEDIEAITKYGIVEAEVVAMGCTSRGQAHRLGEWLLYSERFETESIQFKTGLEGSIVYPGAIIQTQDPLRSGVRMGGRIVTVNNSTTITIDNPITLEYGKTYILSYVAQNGSIINKTLVNTVLPGSPVDTTTIVSTTSMTETPTTGGIWVITISNSLELETWRVISIKENEDLTLDIEAVEHNSSKFNYIEQDAKLQILPISYLYSNRVPKAPTNLSVIESLYQVAPGVLGTKLHLSWQGLKSPNYIVMYRKEFGNWKQELTTIQELEIVGVEEQTTYEIKVAAINSLGVYSVYTPTYIMVVQGKQVPPSDITNFVVGLSSDKIMLTWDDITDLDLAYYEIRYGQWGLDSDTINTIYKGIDNSLILSEQYVSNEIHTFYIKAVDSSGNYSTNYASTGLNVLAPNAPTNLVSNVVNGSWDISWTAAVVSTNRLSTSKYNIYVGNDLNTLVKVDATVSTSYSLNWTYGATTKYIAIETVDIAGTTSTTKLSTSKTVVAPAAPNNLTSTLLESKLLFKWDIANTQSNSLPIEYYELREGGSAWNDAVFIAKIPSSATAMQYLYGIINMVDIATALPVGTLRYNTAKSFKIASLDINGVYSSTYSSYDITITKPSAVTGFTNSVLDAYINTSWNILQPGNGIDLFTLPIDRYEIKRTRSNTYDESVWSNTNSVLVSSIKGGVAQFDPPFNTTDSPVNNQDGNWYFIIRAIDIFNTYGSMTNTGRTIVAPTIPNDINNKVIDNNVLLYWSTPTTHTFPIARYMLKKSSDLNATFTSASAFPIGLKDGGFTSIFEETSGTYKYMLSAIDTAGNIGIMGSTIAEVKQPPDYVLLNDYNRINFNPSAWKLEDAVYDSYGVTYGAQFSVATQLTGPSGVVFSQDGTKMYVASSGNNIIYQYTLSTPWMISTASYATKSLSTSAQISALQCVQISFDGTKVYGVGSNNVIYQYTLSTPWDLSTGTYASISLNLTTQSSNTTAIFISNDGNRLYALDNSNEVIYQYRINTVNNISTAVYENINFDITGYETTPTGFYINNDGTKLFTIGKDLDYIRSFSISNWNISTAVYDNVLVDVLALDGATEGISFSPDGLNLYICGSSNKVFQYKLLNKFGSTVVTTSLSNLERKEYSIGDNTYRVLGPISTSETVAQHFTNTSANSTSYPYHTTAWTTLNSIIADGYDVYGQPAMTSGTMTEVFDIGTLIDSNQYVSVSLLVKNMSGSTGTYKMVIGTSSDNTTYTSVTSATTVSTSELLNFGTFAIGFRYIKIEVVLTDNNYGTDLIAILSYRLKLSIKYTNDGGSGSVADYSSSTATALKGISVTVPGSGYTAAPTVSFSGGGGTSATATAAVSGGKVTAVSITSAGSGFTSSPTISFSGGGGTGATAIAIINGAGIYSYASSAINGGSGYTAAPTVSFSGGGGTGAKGYADISGGAVTAIVITSSGSGYTATPTVSFSGGGGSGASVLGPSFTTASTGTKLSFNYNFIDIASISTSYGGTTAGYAIYDFTDIPNPKTFRVILFNSAGTAITGNFSWTAKGTI